MISEASPVARKPCRRWLQYSLRMLLLLMVPAACVAAWLGAEYRSAQRQRAAIAWVEEMGGKIEYRRPTGKLALFQRLFGDRFPDPVVSVDLSRDLPPGWSCWAPDPPNDKVVDIGPLAELQSLQTLNLRLTRVTDLTPLAELEQLESLHLGGTPVSDISALAGLNNLRQLNLEGTNVRDIEPLTRLHCLEELFLPYTTELTDEEFHVLPPGAGHSPAAYEAPLRRVRERCLIEPEKLRTLQQALPSCKIMYGARPFF